MDSSTIQPSSRTKRVPPYFLFAVSSSLLSILPLPVEFRLRILDGIGWNGSGVTVSASGNDLKERRTLLSLRNRMPPRLLFDIQLNGEASVFTRESCESNARYHRYVEASEEGRRGYHNTRRGQFPSFVRNIYISLEIKKIEGEIIRNDNY